MRYPRVLGVWLLLCCGGTWLAHAAVPPSAPTGWRGDGSGQYTAQHPPVEWSATRHLLWSSKVGAGYSSPLVVGGKILLTADPDRLLCLELSTGNVLWTRNNGEANIPEMHEQQIPHFASCGYATPTPVSDGQWVYAVFGSGVVACYDLDGQPRWRKFFAIPPSPADGRSASPVLFNNRLLVDLGYLMALDHVTGAVFWRAKDVPSGYGTAVAAKIGHTDVVATPGGAIVRVSDGRVLATEVGKTQYTSPIVHDNVLYYVDGTTTAVLLPDEVSDPLELKTLWPVELEGDFYASPFFSAGALYAVNSKGRCYLLDAATGKVLEKKRLDGLVEDAPNCAESVMCYGSFAAAGAHLYLPRTDGVTYTLTAGKTLDAITANSLPEGAGSSPLFAGDCLLLRGGDRLYCIGEKTK